MVLAHCEEQTAILGLNDYTIDLIMDYATRFSKAGSTILLR